MSYLDELNESQLQAALHIEGPAMIIAGPGSGKTRVLTYRIAHLIEQGVDPFQILSLTFTNKAAREMRNRIEHIIGGEARNIFMGTFHSVFARILRVEGHHLGYPQNFTIYDTDDVRSLLKSIVKEQGLNEKLYKPNLLSYRISLAKNNLITPQRYLKDEELLLEDEQSGRPATGKIYDIYVRRCFQAGAMDFDDLLLKFYEVLSKEPEVLYKYQQRFRQILIDEFQDTNFLQYAIVRKIADMHQNITVVGDDAQSIYAFRGATIKNILNFQKDYPELVTFKLEQNYRSTKNIVSAANSIIKHNANQLPKIIWTDNDQGELIKVFKAASDNEEGRIVADRIMELKMRDHFKNEDFAILYRTNAQSRSFEEALRRQNLPYVIYGGMSFYQRKEIKDLVGYLKLTVNHKDEEALKRIINYPARGIGKTSMEKLAVVASQEDKSLWEVLENIRSYGLNSGTTNRIDEFVTMIKSFTASLEKGNAFEVASEIAKSTGLLRELYNDKSVEGLARYENLQELLNGIKEFVEDDTVEEQPAEGDSEAFIPNDKSLASYLQNITLLTSTDQNENDQDTIKLMTLHAAKGLEFPVVFLVGLEESLFPSAMSLYSREDLEEERRLFYVGVTRAETKLFLSYATSRYKFGNLNYCEPSRFLDELPQDILEYTGVKRSPSGKSISPPEPIDRRIRRTRSNTAIPPPSKDFVPEDVSDLQVGQEVEHQRFGQGKVQSLDGSGTNRIATIFFQGHGQKKIMLKFAKLRILSE
jgi:DNA helicase-2/ATP-dependent DNA helicase PcrA